MFQASRPGLPLWTSVVPGRKARISMLVALSAILVFVTALKAATLEEGRKLFEAGKYAEAKAVLEEVAKADLLDHESNFILAKIYYEERNWDKAIEYGEIAVELGGFKLEYQLGLGYAYVAKALTSDQATALIAGKKAKHRFERAVEIDSTNLSALWSLFEYVLEAPDIAGGDMEKARELAGSIYSKDRLVGAQAWGEFWQGEGTLDSAEKYLREAVALDTSSTSDTKYALAYLLQSNGKYDEAVKIFEEIMAKNPQDIHAFYQIGKTYLLAKTNLDKAEACFKKYLEIVPVENAGSRAATYWRLAQVYDLQGKRESALAELQKAIELDPKNLAFKRTLKEFESK